MLPMSLRLCLQALQHANMPKHLLEDFLKEVVCAGARKRLQNSIEDAPRSMVATTGQRHAPGGAAKAQAPAPAARHAIDTPQEQPHVQFPDDSPNMARGMPLLIDCQSALSLPRHKSHGPDPGTRP